MKKITLFFTFLIAFGYSTYAQVSAYSFSQSAGAYTPITGGTVYLTGTFDDGNSGAITIPSFIYNGVPYTDLKINANGHIAFGTYTSTTNYSPLSSTTNATGGIIAGVGRDLNNAASGTPEIRYELIGNEFIVQYQDVRRYNVAGEVFSFQIRLNTSTNEISVVYGGTITPGSNTTYPQIGLKGANNTFPANINNRTIATSGGSWLNSTAGISNASTMYFNSTDATTVPSSGATFTWTPPTPCAGTPVAGTVAPTTQTLLSGQIPAALVASGYSSGVTGLTFQWQESDDDGATDAWANAVGGTGATTASYIPPAFSGTAIYYRLVVTCTNGGGTANTTSVVLNPCGTYSVPTLENFTTYLPGCWQEADNGDLTAGPATFGTGSWVVDGFGNVGATGAIKINIDATGDNDWILSPLYAIPATGYELKFDAAATQFASTNAPTNAWETDDFVEVLVSTGTTNWTVLYTYNDTNVPSNTGTTNIIDLDAYSGQNVRFAFRGVEGATNGTADIDFSVDNFEIRLTPACIEPTTLSASNVLSTSADLSWVDGSGGLQFDYEYVVQAQGTGMPSGAGTALDISSFPLPVNVGSLTPSTPYEFWVRANCGGSGFSTWVGPFNFTTACAIYTVPATEDFTTYVPGCWQEADNGDLTAGPATFGTSSWAEDGFGNVGATGAAKINIWTTGTNDWILSPLYSIPATGYELKFDAAATQFGSTNAPTSAWESDDFVEVLVSTGTTNWTVLYTYNDTNVPSNTGTTNIIDLDAYSGQDVRFAFRGVEGATNGAADIDFSIDNFEIRLTPACSAPIGLVVSNLTDVSADISWTATTGNYEYVLDGLATDPAGSGSPLAVELYNATGLTQSTVYYLHVRTVCSGPSYSAWSTIMFTTLATPPANDNLCNPIALTLGAPTTGNDYTMVGATAETNEPVPACFNGGVISSVWFSFVAPASGSVEVTTDFAGGTLEDGDTEIAVYDATGVTCSDLSTLGAEIGCDQDSGTTNVTWGSFLTLAALTPGNTYYIQVDRYGTVVNGTFGIQVNTVLSSNSFDSNAFLAYPNPVKDVLNLEYNSEISSVKVINLLGQEVISRNINANSAQVDMSQLSAGAYIVNVTVGDAVKTIKVVKQ